MLERMPRGLDHVITESAVGKIEIYFRLPRKTYKKGEAEVMRNEVRLAVEEFMKGQLTNLRAKSHV